MGIPVDTIKEGCCDNDLSNFIIIDGDDLDIIGSTCDKIIKCNDKYILVEEKSLLFGFFNECFNEMNIDIEEYKYLENDIVHLKIDDVIEKINGMDTEVKKRLLSENITNLLSSSLKKVSNTTHILATKFDNTKTANMPIFYLYCNSGKPIDGIMSRWLSRYKKDIFIECNALKDDLQQQC
ncbi:MAG: hypothetical protein U9P72_02805 [Campylobacterota bacterium]|nr:hypothetical protein [Campylobacterota bacterium]